MRAQLNFLELITEGNETQNIRLFDGDTINVARSPVELRDQIIKAGQTNLSPDFLKVYVTGRVREPGKSAPKAPLSTKPLPQLEAKSFCEDKLNLSVLTETALLQNANFSQMPTTPPTPKKSCPNAWRYNSSQRLSSIGHTDST